MDDSNIPYCSSWTMEGFTHSPLHHNTTLCLYHAHIHSICYTSNHSWKHYDWVCSITEDWYTIAGINRLVPGSIPASDILDTVSCNTFYL